MSESPETTNTPPEAKPATPVAKPEAEAPKPIVAGLICAVLNEAGLGLTPVASDAGEIETVIVPREKLVQAAQLILAQGYDLLNSLSGVDWKTHREVVYHFYSSTTHQFLAVKSQVGDDNKIPSLMPVYHAADWHEREAFDLFGIIFEGHPKIERILMPSDWIGHPLLKDYVMNDPRLVWNER